MKRKSARHTLLPARNHRRLQKHRRPEIPGRVGIAQMNSRVGSGTVGACTVRRCHLAVPVWRCSHLLRTGCEKKQSQRAGSAHSGVQDSTQYVVSFTAGRVCGSFCFPSKISVSQNSQCLYMNFIHSYNVFWPNAALYPPFDFSWVHFPPAPNSKSFYKK